MKKITLVAKFVLCCCMLAAMSGTVFAQAVLVDLGATGTVPNSPVPGSTDITNFNGPDVQFADNLNYYDNNNNGNTPAGQLFHVPNPLLLTSVAFQLGGDAGGANYGPSLGPKPFFLRIFSIDGTAATLVATYESQTNATLSQNHWMIWTNITCPLISSSGNFAYTFGVDPDPADVDGSGHTCYQGWCQLWASGNNAYTGGEICTIDNAGGANTVHFGITDSYDGNFDLGLEQLFCPVTTPISILPTNHIFLGSTVTNFETAGGQLPLAYQWQTDGGGGGAFTNIPGAITNVYGPITPQATGTYNFAIIVTNSACGSVTSVVAALIVLPASAPLLTTDIGIYNTNVYGFIGGSVQFHAEFNLGTTPITNQWLFNNGTGYAPIAGATSWYWTRTNVQSPASVGWYELTATNAIGRSNSSAAHLTALADPGAPMPVLGTNIVGTTTNVYNTSFACYVLTNKPWAYWRFEETNDTLTSSMQAYDYSGNNFDATYGNALTNATDGTGCKDGGESWLNGQGGPGSSLSGDTYKYPGFESTNGCASLGYSYANGYLTLPLLNLNTNTVTFTMWIRPNSDIVAANSGLLMNHNGGDAAGVHFGTDLDVNPETGRAMAELGYTWNTNSSATYYFDSHLYPPGGIWSFAAWVITPTNTTIYLYYVSGGHTNLLKAVQTITNSPESFSGGTTRLGGDPAGGNGRTFDGSIDEVAVFTNSLSEAQIQGLYLRSLGLPNGFFPPYIFQPPINQTAFKGQTVQFYVGAGGSPPLTYQWYFLSYGGFPPHPIPVPVVNGDGIDGVTSNTLTLYNVTTNLYVQVKVHNSGGSVTSAWASLTVLQLPTNRLWTVNFNVASGQNGGPIAAYNGRGVLGTGTNWNALRGNQLQNSTSYQDDGVTVSGINFGATNSVGNWYAGGGGGLVLLDQYATWVTNGIEFDFTGVPCGKYNLALYGCVGVFHNHATAFTVQGVTQSVTNQQDINFAPDNTVIYTNLLVTNGTLAVAMIPVYDPYFVPAGYWDPVYAGAFNGAQLQLVTNGPAWTAPFTNNTLTWNYGGLVEATNILGPWTTNRAVSPYTFSPTGSMKFYRIYNPNF